jgi:hypothetical protein
MRSRFPAFAQGGIKRANPRTASRPVVADMEITAAAWMRGDQQEVHMKELITQNVSRRLRIAAMAAAAVGAVLAGTPAAYAWDQQATGAEMDYSLSREVAGQGYTYPGAFAQAPGYSAGPYNPNGPRLHAHRRYTE